MKRYLFLSAIAAFMVFSCSTDKEDEAISEGSIVGTWKFQELNIDNADSPDEIRLANDVIEVLVASGCEILVFDFKSDNTVTASAKDFTETGRDINAEGTGLLIECPSDVETSSSVWELDGDQLTFVDENGLEETITIKLDGDTLTIPAEIVDEDNLDGAEAIFIRE
ncbi:lipocalin family protein [Maribacter sp. TH_r10]|uniref:lipocalin family protein n=1 Tax=Maribacter sp. TH_r10 TaxID=3082086 RepID=UPI00295445AC|nr:lipocalin family protein [Maribacter sp. TH_r10]MDV7139945.1 lipocalin family protein [Maribacter sp. TH_r10]